jgi:UDP:flavonoid glycosyltransferase YjiC (YdhE family)
MTSSIEQLAGKKVLFATISADDHINPLTGFAKHLQDSGCDVRWYASKRYTTKFHELFIYHYTPIKQKDINSGNVNEVHPERARITGRLAKLNFDMLNIFAKPAAKHFENIRYIYEAFRFDILIVDTLFTAAPIIREILGVPVIAVGVVPLTESSRDVPPYGLGMTPSFNPLGRLKQAILRFMTDKVLFKKPFKAYEQIFRKYGITNKGINMLDIVVKNADLVLQLGSPGLEYRRRDIGRNVRYVGPMLPYAAARKDVPWFDERLHQYKDIVLVTQGTTEKDQNKIIIPALEAFRNTDVLIIVTTRGLKTEELRVRYPYRNVIIEDYIPFNDVMPYAKAFITNGYYSGVLLSLQNRLPIIAAGTNECEDELCARIGYLRYGINLHTDTPSPEQIMEAFEDVLDTPSFKANICRLIKEFDQYEPIPLSAGYVAELLKMRSV